MIHQHTNRLANHKMPLGFYPTVIILIELEFQAAEVFMELRKW